MNPNQEPAPAVPERVDAEALMFDLSARGCYSEEDRVSALASERDSAEALLLDCWLQFASFTDEDGTVCYSDMGLSTLEDLRAYLTRAGLIDEHGRPTR